MSTSIASSLASSNRARSLALIPALGAALAAFAGAPVGVLHAQPGAPGQGAPAPRHATPDTGAHRMLRPGPNAPTVAVLLYDDMTPLDVIGPMQMLGMLQMQGWRVVTVAKRRGPVRTDAGTSLSAKAALAEVPKADVLLVPGGLEGGYRAARDTAITHWVARVHRTTRVTASVCLGAWILAGAGVLQRGDTAATHWLGREELERSGVVYTPARVHHAGKVWTSAGVSAGIDLGLALVDRLGGRALAEQAQLVAQYDPQPPLDAGSPDKAPAAAAAVRAMHEQMMADIEARAREGARSGAPAGTR